LAGSIRLRGEDAENEFADLCRVCGGEKVGHWSGGVMPLRAE
jgi:hypothetical protein